MGKVNISTHSGLVSGGDWQPALDASWNDIKSEGGSIVFDADVTLKSQDSLTGLGSPFTVIPLNLVGGEGKIVTINATNSVIPFYAGNLVSLKVSDLTVLGTGPATNQINAQDVFFLTYCQKAIFDNCVLGGLGVKSGMIHTYDATDLIVIDSQISGGCTTDLIAGAIYCEKVSKRVIIHNCDFYDYQNYKTVNWSKTPNGVSSWIRISNPVGAGLNNGANHVTIDITDCRFDEGSGNAIHITGYPLVNIDRCAVNLNSGGFGIYLEDVNHAIIKQSNFGYAATDVPAIKLINCGNVVVAGCTSDHGINRIEVDSASAAGLKVIQSPDLTVDVV